MRTLKERYQEKFNNLFFICIVFLGAFAIKTVCRIESGKCFLILILASFIFIEILWQTTKKFIQKELL